LAEGKVPFIEFYSNRALVGAEKEKFSEFYRLKKLYTKLKKRGWSNPELQDR